MCAGAAYLIVSMANLSFPRDIESGLLTESKNNLAVQCQDLSFKFGDKVAVDRLDLEVARGEVFGLLGPNGAGKTTTIRVITTLLPCPRGTVLVFGQDVAAKKMAVRRLLGYVPQQLSADGTLTGWENVMLSTRLYDVPRKHRRAVAREALESMGLGDAAGRMARTYSGGMIRRLELAQALVSRPRLLILDEPTIGLDPIGRADVWQRLQDLRASSGMTIFLTTHYMEEADRLCDRIAMMHHGSRRALGTPAELKAAVAPNATLEDVFRHFAGGELGEEGEGGGGFRAVRGTRRTASRLG